MVEGPGPWGTIQYDRGDPNFETQSEHAYGTGVRHRSILLLQCGCSAPSSPSPGTPAAYPHTTTPIRHDRQRGL